MATKQFMTIDNLTLYDQLIKSKMATDISAAEARSLHTVALDGTTLKFYREEEPVGSATPAYSISLPQQDLSNFLQKITGATGGKVVASVNDGTITESAVNIADLVVDSDLAAVATSGEADDVTYDNTTSGLTSTDVQAAIDELAGQSAGGVASKTVYITQTPGGSSDPYSKRYGIYQGATGSSASPVAGEKLADIDIPKDMVVESGSVGTVTTPDDPYPGAQVGDKYIDLVLANASATHIYIPANSLVDVYTAQQNATQVQLAIDSNNVISATIVAGSIGTTELAGLCVTTAKVADGAITAAKLATDSVVTAKIEDEAVTEDKLSAAVQAKLNAASGVQSVTEGSTNGTLDVDGTDVPVHGLGTAAFTDSTAYDAAGAAANVQTTLIGASTDPASASTIYGAKAYADASTEAIPEASIRALFPTT